MSQGSQDETDPTFEPSEVEDGSGFAENLIDSSNTSTPNGNQPEKSKRAQKAYNAENPKLTLEKKHFEYVNNLFYC
jgi:hypothetical protein